MPLEIGEWARISLFSLSKKVAHSWFNQHLLWSLLVPIKIGFLLLHFYKFEVGHY